MSFFTIPGPIVICNFSARANRHRRYRHRQLSENKLTFSASISILYPRHNGQLLTKRMHTFIGVDVSCQSNIRRMQNWHWRWWGNPHAYIYQLIKGPSEGDAGFFFSLYIADAVPLKFLLSFHMKGFYISCLSWHGYTCLISSPSAEPSRLQALSRGALEEECRLLGRLTTNWLHRSSWWINCFIHRLINSLFTREVLSFTFQIVFGSTLFTATLHPRLCTEEFKTFCSLKAWILSRLHLWCCFYSLNFHFVSNNVKLAKKFFFFFLQGAHEYYTLCTLFNFSLLKFDFS